jgi:hypothetical protein
MLGNMGKNGVVMSVGGCNPVHGQIFKVIIKLATSISKKLAEIEKSKKK